jgi:hypothetical protein
VEEEEEEEESKPGPGKGDGGGGEGEDDFYYPAPAKHRIAHQPKSVIVIGPSGERVQASAADLALRRTILAAGRMHGVPLDPMAVLVAPRNPRPPPVRTIPLPVEEDERREDGDDDFRIVDPAAFLNPEMRESLLHFKNNQQN